MNVELINLDNINVTAGSTASSCPDRWRCSALEPLDFTLSMCQSGGVADTIPFDVSTDAECVC